MAASDLLPFAELWPRVAAGIVVLAAERVAAPEALYRVLARDARAAWDLPGADSSAMDGWAVRAADTAGASSDRPAELAPLAVDAYAGSAARPQVTAGTAAPIGTGGVLPEGADAIAQKEIVRVENGQVRVTVPVEPGTHVRRRGEELGRGDVVLTAGSRLDPLRLAAASAAGAVELEVSGRPRVAVVATGTELVPVGAVPAPGQVVDSNGPLISRWVEGLLGVEPAALRHVSDDEAEHERVLGAALDEADVLVVTGGVSVGDRDLVKATLEERLGVERLVWRVAMKPGKPTYVGRRGGSWVVGLPGNPAAVAVGWQVLVRPLLLALQGACEPEPRRLPVRLAAPVKPNHLRTVLRWCRLDWREGAAWAEPLARADSHMLSDLARADVLAVIPAGDDEVVAGTGLDAILIER